MFFFVSFREETFIFSIDSSARDFVIGFSSKIDASNDLFCLNKVEQIFRIKREKLSLKDFPQSINSGPIFIKYRRISLYSSWRHNTAKKYRLVFYLVIYFTTTYRLFSERIHRRNEHFFFCWSLPVNRTYKDEVRSWKTRLSSSVSDLWINLSVSRVVEKNQLSERENHFNETFSQPMKKFFSLSKKTKLTSLRWKYSWDRSLFYLGKNRWKSISRLLLFVEQNARNSRRKITQN